MGTEERGKEKKSVGEIRGKMVWEENSAFGGRMRSVKQWVENVCYGQDKVWVKKLVWARGVSVDGKGKVNE